MCCVAKGTAGTDPVEEGGDIITTAAMYAVAVIVAIWFIRRRKHRMSISEMPQLPMSPWVATLLFFGSFVLGSVGAVVGMSQGEHGTMEQLGWISLCALAAQLPVVFVYAFYPKPSTPSRRAMVVAVGFVVFTPLAMVTASVAHTMFSALGWEDPNGLGHETLLLLKTSSFSTASVLVIFAATIGAGIIEEVVFRGVLFPSIPLIFRGVSVWGAAILTSVIFALMHMGSVPPSALAGLFVLSVGLCWARVNSGGVLAPIVIHILFNALNIALVL